MSTRAVQTAPRRRSFCRVDEEVSLNDIARVITTLNLKTLRLRNEVNAFKTVTANGERKLSAESGNFVEPLFSRWNGEGSATYRETVELDRLTIPEVPETHAIRDKSINDCKFKPGKGNNEATNTIEVKEVSQKNFLCQSEIKENAYYNRVYNKPLRIRKKKISRKTQCDLPMERKRRNFLNCFKTNSYNEDHKLLKLNKPGKTSLKSKVRVSFDPRIDEMDLSEERRNDEDMFEDMQQEHYEDDQTFYTVDARDEIIDWIYKPVEIEPPKGKETSSQFSRLQENNVCNDELDKHQTVLQMDAASEQELFKCPVTGRMGGGAEFRGGRLLSNLNDKMHKLNLYMNVKFDAQNVKRRLDDCIAQLNGIIDDVSLIFTNADALKRNETEA